MDGPLYILCVVHTLILFYKQHMLKKTSWTILDFIQSLLIFVAQCLRENAQSLLKKILKKKKLAYYFVDNWLFTRLLTKMPY